MELMVHLDADLVISLDPGTMFVTIGSLIAVSLTTTGPTFSFVIIAVSFFGFDFVAFGFPYWWYPDYYYGYPYGYASYDYSPVYYDYRYWYGLSTAVQTELARRGYYHGPIDGEIGSGSREAIRSFQKAEGLPVTGLIDPRLLKALKLPTVPRVATS